MKRRLELLDPNRTADSRSYPNFFCLSIISSKCALNLLRAEKSTKVSIPIKQAKASRKTEYLDKILACEAATSVK